MVVAPNLDQGSFYRDLEPKLAEAHRCGRKRQVRPIHAKSASRRKDALHNYSRAVVNDAGAVFVANIASEWPIKSGNAKATLDVSWATLRNLPPDLRRGRPARAQVPPGARGTEAMGCSRQVGPVQPVYNADRSSDTMKGTGGITIIGRPSLIDLLEEQGDPTLALLMGQMAAHMLADHARMRAAGTGIVRGGAEHFSNEGSHVLGMMLVHAGKHRRQNRVARHLLAEQADEFLERFGLSGPISQGWYRLRRVDPQFSALRVRVLPALGPGMAGHSAVHRSEDCIYYTLKPMIARRYFPCSPTGNITKYPSVLTQTL